MKTCPSHFPGSCYLTCYICVLFLSQAQRRVCADAWPDGAGADGQDAHMAGLPGGIQPALLPVLCTQRNSQVSV